MKKFAFTSHRKEMGRQLKTYEKVENFKETSAAREISVFEVLLQ
jgi:hypothetical protein